MSRLISKKLTMFLKIFLLFICISGGNFYSLNVVHVNDFHARYDEISVNDSPCKDSTTCIGGFSRLYTKINALLKEKPDSVLLNGGDNFQGSLYYNLYKWNITQYFFNMIPFDAYVLGNQEFEDNIAGLVPFIQNLKSPVVVSNINDTLEPSFQGLYNKSIVLERGGKKIGIIGVITTTTKNRETTGNLIFLNEIESVNAEAERLVREEGVFTNIVLSHSGYDVDQQIAKNATNKISLIVGGDTHTFLDSDNPPVGPDTPKGPYPTVVQRDSDGKNVLVVQASAYSKYVGQINVTYDDNGDVESFEGGPIFLDHASPQDENINALLAPWKAGVDQANVVLGQSLVLLDHKNCTLGECNLGNLVGDLFVENFTLPDNSDSWTSAAVAIVNPSTFRTSIDKGNITLNDFLFSLPYTDTVDSGDIQGKYIKEIFEHAWQIQELLQVSGLRVIFDPQAPVGDQVRSVKVRCSQCKIPIYEDLDLNKTYRIILTSYLRAGGGGYTIVKDNLLNVTIGPSSLAIFQDAFATKSPLYGEVEGRIQIINNYSP